MSVESERIKRIRKRWTEERKVSSPDVDWLLEQADKAETMRAAHSLKQSGGALSDLLGGLFK